jgi:hypothetical protein
LSCASRQCNLPASLPALPASTACLLAPPASRSLPGEDDAALLQRALSHLGASTRAGEAPPQAAALLQRLSSLVQAGVPMARRGAFWRLFLNIDSKRRQGEYQQLLGEVAELERMQNRFDGDSSSSGGGEQGGCYGAAAAAKAGGQQQQQQHHPPGAVVSLVADGRRGSSGGAGSADATAAAAAAAAASYHRIDVFSITRLDESPECTPLKQPAAAASGQDDAGCSGTGEGLGSTAAEAMSPLHTTPLAGLAASGLAVTPASTLTPLACDTGSSASSGTQADGGSEGAVSMGRAASSLLGSAERWRQQDFMAQIDKDLVGAAASHVFATRPLCGALPSCAVLWLLLVPCTIISFTSAAPAALSDPLLRSTAPSRGTPAWTPRGAPPCAASLPPVPAAPLLWDTARA